jgi:hypothetical protein
VRWARKENSTVTFSPADWIGQEEGRPAPHHPCLVENRGEEDAEREHNLDEVLHVSEEQVCAREQHAGRRRHQHEERKEQGNPRELDGRRNSENGKEHAEEDGRHSEIE